MELGIDIGGMGGSSSGWLSGYDRFYRQQAGRAGRGSEASLAVLVATADPSINIWQPTRI